MSDSAIREPLSGSAADTDTSESVVASNAKRDVVFLLLFFPLLGLFSLGI